MQHDGSDAVAAVDAVTGNSGPGGRLSYVDLSGGFGTIRMGQIWSASGTHYYFKVDPSHWATVQLAVPVLENANSISYSSSAGDVSFSNR